ncbi:MAG: N-acetyl-gamma-glutamyl-phosphate reductase, partial [uncultured Nocardioidaceae bacterium]
EPAQRRRARHRLRRRLPARGQLRLGHVLRRRARGVLALRPARAARTTGTARGSPPDRGARVLSHRVHARPRPGGRRRPRGHRRRRRRRRQRHQRSRQGPQGEPARQRGDGQRQCVRRRRSPPAHARDRPEPQDAGGCPGRRAHQLHAAARADEPRHPGDLLGSDDRRRGGDPDGLREGLCRRAVRAPPSCRVLAADPGGARVQRGAPAGDRRRGSRADGRGGRGGQPGQGHRRGRRAVHEPRPGAARGHRAHHRRDGPM